MSTTRRTALKRGLLVLGGVFGAGTAGTTLARAQADPAAPPAAGPGAQVLTLHGGDWHSFSRDKGSGQLPDRGDRMVGSGDLLASPGGEKIGEFHAALFSLGAPGVVGGAQAASLELHTFNLEDGTIIGTGTGTLDSERPDSFAILGGTGRYAGARGSYLARQRHRELGGDGTAEFTFTFVVQEA